MDTTSIYQDHIKYPEYPHWYVYKSDVMPGMHTGRCDMLENDYENRLSNRSPEAMLKKLNEKFPELKIYKSLQIYQPMFGMKFETNDGDYYVVQQYYKD